jgi:hypothetical protein
MEKPQQQATEGEKEEANTPVDVLDSMTQFPVFVSFESPGKSIPTRQRLMDSFDDDSLSSVSNASSVSPSPSPFSTPPSAFHSNVYFANSADCSPYTSPAKMNRLQFREETEQVIISPIDASTHDESFQSPTPSPSTRRKDSKIATS